MTTHLLYMCLLGGHVPILVIHVSIVRRLCAHTLIIHVSIGRLCAHIPVIHVSIS